MSHSITLTWNASTDAVAGYNVYRGLAAGTESITSLNGTTLVTALTYVDTNVLLGQTYSYVVTAVENGVESLHSNEAITAVSLPSAPTNLVAKAV